MGFADDWKAAKTVFENATKAKKPSASFLGVFRKSTGIEGALKDADKAKTAGDLRKAIVALKTATSAYMVTLNKTIDDPKAVESEAKKTYVAASMNLKAALARILESAESTAASLGDADKKAAVDPAKVREKVEAEKLAKIQAENLRKVKEHVALRQRVFLALQKIEADYAKRGREVEESVTLVKKHIADARAAKKRGETMQADVSAGVVKRFAEQASQQLASIQAHWKEFAREGGDLMNARGDEKKAMANLPPGNDHYHDEANKLFGAGDKIQQGIQTRFKALEVAVKEAAALAEEAESYQMGSVDPRVFHARATEIHDRMVLLVKDLTVRRDKAAGWGRLGPTLATKDQKGKEQTAGIVRTVLGKHAEVVREVNLLAGRLEKFPPAAKEDSKVSEVVEAAKKLIQQFGDEQADVTTAGQQLLDLLGG